MNYEKNQPILKSFVVQVSELKSATKVYADCLGQVDEAASTTSCTNASMDGHEFAADMALYDVKQIVNAIKDFSVSMPEPQAECLRKVTESFSQDDGSLIVRPLLMLTKSLTGLLDEVSKANKTELKLYGCKEWPVYKELYETNSRSASRPGVGLV